MNIGETKFGFKLLRVRPVEDIKATLYEFEHLKSGGTVAYLDCDDTNCVMAIGFRTMPEDSTGVCHIIEHSVLCGSKKYPLKEPFVNLLKTSLATFLNAFTAYDWTMYPCASQTPKDFDNIMDVYLDAVFNPKSMNDIRPFLQEGWHLELTDEDALPCYKGVVYNEMKGAMSSVREVLTQTALEAMYPDNGYRHNSGGEPDDIPNLTYEAYKSFYAAHYNPQNAMMLLYGKMNIEDKLAYIDREYYSKYDRGEPLSIPRQSPIINLDLEKEYEIGQDEEIKDNCYVALRYAIADYNNPKECIAWKIIDDALMTDEGSVLKKALMDRHLGANVYSTIDDDNIQEAFTVVLEKTNPAKKKELLTAFEEEVAKLVANGIDKEALVASLNNAEFKAKENDMGGFPKGIVYAMAMMGSFNYNGDFMDSLEVLRYYQELREDLNNGYFEALLKKYILESKHKVLVMVKPSKTLGEEKKAKMDALMKAKKDALSKEEVKALVKQTKELLAYQAHLDTPKELKCLPTLKKSDIDPKSVNFLGTKKTKTKGITTLLHEGETNGISYMNAYFDLSSLTAEELPLFGFLTGLFANVPTAHYDLGQIGNEIKKYLGDLSFSYTVFGDRKDPNIAKPLAVITCSVLKENLDKAVELINEVLFHSTFPAKLVQQYLVRTVNDTKMAIMGNGMSVAMNEASKYHSAGGAISASFGGIASYNAMKKMLENFDIKALKASFKSIIAKVYNKKGCTLSYTGNKEILSLAKQAYGGLKLKRGEQENKLSCTYSYEGAKAMAIPAQITYNGMAGHVDPGKIKQGHAVLVGHILRLNYLWDNVRVKGGAYGCSVSVAPNGVICFGSYRDPNCKATYEIYENASSYLRELAMTKKEFLDSLIGAIGAFDKPLSIRALGATCDARYFVGTTKADLIAAKKDMLHATLDDVRGYADILDEALGNVTRFTVGNKSKLEEYPFVEIKTL